MTYIPRYIRITPYSGLDDESMKDYITGRAGNPFGAALSKSKRIVITHPDGQEESFDSMRLACLELRCNADAINNGLKTGKFSVRGNPYKVREGVIESHFEKVPDDIVRPEKVRKGGSYLKIVTVHYADGRTEDYRSVTNFCESLRCKSTTFWRCLNGTSDIFEKRGFMVTVRDGELKSFSKNPKGEHYHRRKITVYFSKGPKTFETIAAAAEEIGVTAPSLSYGLRIPGTCAGYKVEFADE